MDYFVASVFLGVLVLILTVILWIARVAATRAEERHEKTMDDLEKKIKELNETVEVYRGELDTERLNHVVTVDQVTESGYQSSRDLLDQVTRLQADLDAARRQHQEEIAVLLDLSTTDPLTGLGNLRGLESDFETEYARFKRAQIADPNINQQVVVVTIDLDHFKKLNDNAGHDAGDRALRAIARILRECFEKRPSDDVYRLGGDEFVAVLPGATTDHAVQSALEVINALERQLELRWHEKEAGVTASFGITIGAFDLKISPSKWLTALRKESDHALYAAKNAGRRTVCVYGQSPSLGIKLDGL